MALSAFDDKSHMPTEADLAEVLGKGKGLWDELKRHLAERFAPLAEKWNFSGKSYGWGLQLKQKQRTVLYMTPNKGYFLASFALGEKAVRAAREGALPDSVLDVIDRAPRYAEGRGVRLEVKSKKDLGSIKKLAAIKMAS